MTAPVIDLSTRRLLRQVDEALSLAHLPLGLWPRLARSPAPELTLGQATALVAHWERRCFAAWCAVDAAPMGQLVAALDTYEAAQTFLEAAERMRRRLLVAAVAEGALHG